MAQGTRLPHRNCWCQYVIAISSVLPSFTIAEHSPRFSQFSSILKVIFREISYKLILTMSLFNLNGKRGSRGLMYRMYGGITSCCMGGVGSTNVVELNVHPTTAPTPDIFSVPIVRQAEAEKRVDILLLPGVMENLKEAFPPPVKYSLVGPSLNTFTPLPSASVLPPGKPLDDTLGKFNNLSCHVFEMF